VSLPHTLADVSRAVNVSATTIKYYLNHLPRLIEFEGHGRKRRFSDRAVQMLSDVRRMLADENKSLTQIRQELEGLGGGPASHHHVEKATVAAAPAAKVSGSLEDLMGVLIGEVRAMRSEVERLRRTRWLPTD
jgi:DNA-binding transcriptional MerR regulator